MLCDQSYYSFLFFYAIVPSLFSSFFFFFFFNDTATTEIYTLSLHDALPIFRRAARRSPPPPGPRAVLAVGPPDRKSTRLNSSHVEISYAVFCLKKKKKKKQRKKQKTKNLKSTSIRTYLDKSLS